MIVESYEDVVVLSGALRSNFWETIHTAISLTLKRHPTGVIIDCSGLTEATPEGAETFRDVMAFIEERQEEGSEARVIVAAVPEPIMEVLKTVPEVRSQLAVAASVEEARHSLDLLLVEEARKWGRKRPSAPPRLRKLLICLSGEASDDYLLSVAREIGESTLSELYFMVPVIVPREMPLTAPLPQAEEQALGVLEHAKALLEESEVAHSIHVARGRDVAHAIQEALEEVDVAQVMIALSSEEDEIEATLKLVKAVLSKVQKPVLFVRGQLNSESALGQQVKSASY